MPICAEPPLARLRAGLFFRQIQPLSTRESGIGFDGFHCEFTRAADDGGLFFGARVMTWLLIFFGVWPIALVVLLRFAARVDPRSGQRRRR
ncbi:hypothetical protein [Paraburkholderia antibiotica]|uniref:Uncharacterized protein n=1 Tax=Paraburkholderia antibiotica TaxID=2728839 RepID=A0A7X9X1B6_9BURK|nr:hypothetical protein [Paraburkholderia antibiotica]NML29615.1 hypothetical protein [Paraburkholderia antibiotica]